MPDPLSFPSATPRHALPMLFAGQAQKEVTVNEALIIADILMHSAVEAAVNVPPAAPVAGQCWLVGTTPTGVFVDRAGAIAAWTDGGWRFLPPRDGMKVYDKELGCWRIHAAGWRVASAPPAVSGGTVIDVEARAAIATLVARLREAGIFSAA